MIASTAYMARVVPEVLQQHLEEAAHLHRMRQIGVRAPHFKLLHLARLDERIGAHLDGLVVADADGLKLCDSLLESLSAGSVFATITTALELRDSGKLNRLLRLVEALPAVRAGLLSAFGWTAASALQGIVAPLLSDDDAFNRLVGVAACGMHRIDPGLTRSPEGHRGIADESPMVRARAWRAAGELGKRELVSTAAAAALADEDPTVQFWAAWSAALLGDKHHALDRLIHFASSPGPLRARAFQLAIQAMSVEESHALLQPLASDPSNTRRLIRGAGFAGDPTYVPWLVGLMSDDKLARLAGESFSLMTGLDLAWLDLERKPPQNFASGPNDDPNDSNVDMDEDDGLPWPDQKLIQAWWSANAHRFQAGVRCFMGEPLNRDNCLRVLKGGYQRQRIAAALYLALLTPGTPLFEWRAPAWRQQRLLATMR